MASTIIPARAVIPFLVGMMLLTGVCNTLLTKYQVRNLPFPLVGLLAIPIDLL